MSRAASLGAGLLVLSLAACSGGSSGGAPSRPGSPSPSTSPSVTPARAAVTCPLTGVPPTKAENPHRVALAVKIDNIDLARPQAGIDRADVVFEETVEGGLTRLFAVFQCDAPATVGPIRSARTTDGDLLRLLDGAVFAYSGANPRAIAPVRATSKAVLVAFDDSPQYFHRDPGRPAPHDVLSSSATLLKAGTSRRKGLHAPRPLFRYGPAAHLDRKVRTVSVRYPAASATWTWSGHDWVRTQNGTPDVAADGARVRAANVLVMSIEVKDTGLHDVLGNPSPDDVVTGKGTLWAFRNGHLVRGTWHRRNAAAGFTFTDRHGAPLLLHPGRTWVELLPRPGKPTLG